MDTLPAAPVAITVRHRFVEDMRGFSEKTCNGYIRIVAGFVAFLGRSPATATAEGIRCFQVQPSARGMGAPAMNSNVAALRFFFTYTLDRPDLAASSSASRIRKRPSVLAPDEMARLIAATTCLKR